MTVDIGLRADVFYVLEGETKYHVFQWLISWAKTQHHEAWAEFNGATIKAGTGTTLEELEKRWAHLPDVQRLSGERAKARP